jgi:uncharacterized protein (TIGR02453 family)
VNARNPLDDSSYPPFEGFPREALSFLRKLKRNNNRAWFQAHRTEYEECVRFPMQTLIADLARDMAGVAPEIEFHPVRSIFRIYRDVRFSTNKAPYKTNIAASFEVRSGAGPTETPGLYVGIEPGEIWVGGGLYMPTAPQLKAIRRSIAEEPEGWLAVVEAPRFRKVFGGIDGEKLSRAPLGYPADHPMIEHLKHKQLYAGVVLDDAACHSPRFLKKVESVFTDLMPLIRWLVKATS